MKQFDKRWKGVSLGSSTVTIGKAGYLWKLKELLSEGKSVIICSKNNKTGSKKAQHWVVVTVYNGKGPATENVTINDPGRNTCKTFKEFLNYYYKNGCTFSCLWYYK